MNGVANEKIGVANEKIGVANEKNGVANEKAKKVNIRTTNSTNKREKMSKNDQLSLKSVRKSSISV